MVIDILLLIVGIIFLIVHYIKNSYEDIEDNSLQRIAERRTEIYNSGISREEYFKIFDYLSTKPCSQVYIDLSKELKFILGDNYRNILAVKSEYELYDGYVDKKYMIDDYDCSEWIYELYFSKIGKYYNFNGTTFGLKVPVHSGQYSVLLRFAMMIEKNLQDVGKLRIAVLPDISSRNLMTFDAKDISFKNEIIMITLEFASIDLEYENIKRFRLWDENYNQLPLYNR